MRRRRIFSSSLNTSHGVKKICEYTIKRCTVQDSEHSALYAQFRPVAPPSLLLHIRAQFPGDSLSTVCRQLLKAVLAAAVRFGPDPDPDPTVYTIKSGNLVTFLVHNIFFLRKFLRTHAVFLVLKVV
jgi:hypothetical protein